MNLKGLEYLKEKALPIPRDLLIFKNMDETKEHLAKYPEEKQWSMRGFYENHTINDHPYKIKNFAIHGFIKSQITEIFKKINDQMDSCSIPSEERIFFICEVFFNEDVNFSGHIIKEKENLIFIDIKKGNRPSGEDWTPDFSIVLNGGENNFEAGEFKEEINKIIREIKVLPEKSYLDFTKLNEGYLMFHDMTILKR